MGLSFASYGTSAGPRWLYTVGVIEVGTSGFSFDDWVGPVYPRDIPKSQWLPYYNHVLGFRLLELNSSFYSLIAAPSVERMIAATTADFRFVVKAHQALTHKAIDAQVLERFRGTVDLFRAAGRFTGTLAQYPPSFLPREESWSALEALHEKLGDPFFVEFRNRAWTAAATWERLRKAGIATCVTDLPPIRSLPDRTAVVTAGTAYLRLHGRSPHWFSDAALRYSYSYSEAELSELLGVARELERSAPQVLVFFNNCHSGQAAQNALRFAKLLDAAG